MGLDRLSALRGYNSQAAAERVGAHIGQFSDAVSIIKTWKETKYSPWQREETVLKGNWG